MRTTISVDDHLLARLKKQASESGTTVSGLIDRAIRLLLERPTPGRRKVGFELITFGAGGSFSKRNLDKTSSLLEEEDVERFTLPR